MRDRELIYMWIASTSNRAVFINQGIQFSNNYIVNISIDEYNVVQSVDIRKKENLYESLYGNNIINISALVGINGMGKTTLLDMLGTTRSFRKRYVYQWDYFMIYRIDNIYVIGGNGKAIINEIVEKKPDLINESYSLICQYAPERKKFKFNRLCYEEGDIEKSIKYIYFHDKPIDEQGFLTREIDLDYDYSTCFERIAMYSSPANIYKTCFFLKYDNNINKSINLNNLNFYVHPNVDLIVKPSKMLTPEIRKQIFIFKSLLAIAEKCEDGKKCVDKICELFGKQRTEYIEFDTDVYRKYKYDIVREIKNLNSDEKIDFNLLETLVLNLPDEYFMVDDRNRMTAYDDPVFTIKKEYLKCLYELLYYFEEYLIFTYSGISAGEKKILDVFSGLFTNILNSKSNHQEDEMYIILLDEPDKGLHPEMSRCLISWLVKLFGSTGSKFKYQFIITTHSPFLISDIPIPNIHCLDRNNGCINIEESSYGFLSSIPDILKDTFFMTSPFGEFGNLYFSNLVEEIKNFSNIGDRVQRKKLEKKIEIVSDKVLKHYLAESLEEKIVELSDRDQQILYYEEKIRDLKGKNL